MGILLFVASLILSAVIAVFSLHLGVELLVGILGPSKCLSTSSINGCTPWLLATIVSTCCCVFLYTSMGYAALLAAPVGPLLAIVLVSLQLRFGEPGARNQEFGLTERGIIELRTGVPLRPDYARSESAYYCTGPASGYVLYGIQLRKRRKTIAANGYVSEQAFREHYNELVQRLDVPSLDLRFAIQAEGKKLYLVCLGSEWGDLVLGHRDRFPPEEWAWWENLLARRLGNRTDVTVRVTDLRGVLEFVEKEFAETCRASERLQEDISVLRRLAQRADGTIGVFTSEGYEAYTKAVQGDSPVEVSCEEGIWVEQPWEKD